MLWRLTLAVVCVGAICSCMKTDLASRLMMPRDYGVKLCGREFIRAVIFTCGGSRWRRATGGGGDPFPRRSLSDVTVEENHHTWQSGPEFTADDLSPPQNAGSLSLADLLALYGATGDGPSLADLALQQTTVLGQRDGERAAAVSSKKKRNFSLGVAGKCCNQGCSKNDIGRLC
ncbi:uncharacterized protein ACO6RY_06204 [Pungitius sinensis]